MANPAVAVKVDIKGGKELERALRDLPNKVARKVVRQATRAASKPVLAAAKQNVPVESGELKKHLKLTTGKRRVGSFFMFAGLARNWNLGEAFYGGFLEWGYLLGPRRGVSRYQLPNGQWVTLSSRARRVVPEKPFLRPAFDECKGEALQIMQERLKEGIEAVAENKTPPGSGAE